MSVTLDQAKAHLRILNTLQDTEIGSLVLQSKAMLQRLLEDAYSETAEDLNAAQLLIIEWLFRPDDNIPLDDIYHLPRAVVALAVPYRALTLR